MDTTFAKLAGLLQEIAGSSLGNGLFVLVGLCVLAFVAYVGMSATLARSKGRSMILWTFLCCIMPPLFIVLLSLKSADSEAADPHGDVHVAVAEEPAARPRPVVQQAVTPGSGGRTAPAAPIAPMATVRGPLQTGRMPAVPVADRPAVTPKPAPSVDRLEFGAPPSRKAAATRAGGWLSLRRKKQPMAQVLDFDPPSGRQTSSDGGRKLQL